MLLPRPFRLRMVSDASRIDASTENSRPLAFSQDWLKRLTWSLS
jgi:hypothetical protein